MNVPRSYIELINDMYEGAATSMRTTRGEICQFPVTIYLHQLLVLSPYLFALNMDELIAYIQEKVL